jgi:hypothetical protein
MEYKCDHKGFDREEIVSHIEKYGCHVVMVIGDHLPGFAYSIGLYEKFGHPEIICFGMDLKVMASMINEVCYLLNEGRFFEPYKPYDDFLENVNIQFVPVDKGSYDDYFGLGIKYYKGNNFSAMQMVWPDKENKFPWEEVFYKPWKFQQPLLDRNADFKFYEERNQSVFTSQHVLDGNPILHVFNNADGDWQFHSNYDVSEDEPKVVCLEDIVRLDPTLNKLYDLKPGWSASREDIHAKWERSEFEDKQED